MSTNLNHLIHDRIWNRALAEGSLDPGQITWQVGHERLVRTAARRAALDAEEALWLVVCEELRADRHLSYMPVAEVVRIAFVAIAGLPSQQHVFQAREALATYTRLEAAA